MRFTLLVTSAVLLAPVVAMAADARHPYSNIDTRVDAGNDTGDSQVDQLNSRELSGGSVSTDRNVSPGAVAPVASGYPAPYYGGRVYVGTPVYAYGPPVFHPRPVFRRRFFYEPRVVYGPGYYP